MKRKIHSRVTIEIETGKVLSDTWFWYDGPVALCGGGSGETQEAERQLSERQIALAERSERRGGKLFGLTFPGLEIAEKYYQSLASGDPNEIFRAIAPATEQIHGFSEQARERISTQMPRGGEQRLAEEQSFISEAGQVGQLATRAYTSSFPALVSIAGQGIGLGINEVANAIASFGGAGQTLGNLGSQQAAGKAATMGFLGSLAGAAGTIGGAKVG